MILPDFNDLMKLKDVAVVTLAKSNYANLHGTGNCLSALNSAGMEFAAVREYMPGDEVRIVDWRVTARAGKMHVKTFQMETDRNVFVAVDVNYYMRFATRGTFKSVQAAKLAALISFTALTKQDRVGGLVVGDVASGMQYFPVMKNENNIIRMLNLLCSMPVTTQPLSIIAGINRLVELLDKRGVIFIISDFIACDLSELQLVLSKLRSKHDIVLCPISDPIEQEFPNVGTIILQDRKQITFNSQDPKARKMYGKLWDVYWQEFKQMTKKLFIQVVPIMTNQDIITLLRKNHVG